MSDVKKNEQQAKKNSLINSGLKLSLFTLISRVLGLIREMTKAAFLGTSNLADAFGIAFMIPNLFRRLFAENSISVAFIPTFKKYLENQNHDSTKKSESADEKPVEKPIITEDTANPEKQPEYTEDIPQVSEPKAEQSAPPSTSADKPSENSGQVYDPVFGWIDTGSTHQDTVDSSGSINKQIGSMN